MTCSKSGTEAAAWRRSFNQKDNSCIETSLQPYYTAFPYSARGQDDKSLHKLLQARNCERIGYLYTFLVSRLLSFCATPVLRLHCRYSCPSVLRPTISASQITQTKIEIAQPSEPNARNDEYPFLNNFHAVHFDAFTNSDTNSACMVGDTL